MASLLTLVTLHAACALFRPVTFLVALKAGACLLGGVSRLVVPSFISVAVTVWLGKLGFGRLLFAVARDVTSLVAVVTGSVGSLILSLKVSVTLVFG